MTQTNDNRHDPSVKAAPTGPRDVREIVRDEQVMRRRILAALADGPLTVPEIGRRARAAGSTKPCSG